MRLGTMMMIGAMVLAVTIPAVADERERASTRSMHLKVGGTVSKIQSGLITGKTPRGSRTFASAFTPHR